MNPAIKRFNIPAGPPFSRYKKSSIRRRLAVALEALRLLRQETAVLRWSEVVEDDWIRFHGAIAVIITSIAAMTNSLIPTCLTDGTKLVLEQQTIAVRIVAFQKLFEKRGQ